MKRVILTATLGVIILLGLALIFYRSQVLRLVRTVPKDGADNVTELTEVTFIFSRPMAAATLYGSEEATNHLKISPPLAGAVKTDGKKIVFIPSGQLTAGQRYLFQLTSITAASGKKGKAVSLGFSLSSSFGEGGKIRQFIATLPYLGERFNIDYIPEGNFFSVDILEDPADEVKREALKFLAERGVTPANAEISFYLIPGVGGSAGLAP